MRKKIVLVFLSIIVVASLCLGLAGCTQDDSGWKAKDVFSVDNNVTFQVTDKFSAIVMSNTAISDNDDEQNRLTYNFMDKIVKDAVEITPGADGTQTERQPDLLIFNGDMIRCSDSDADNLKVFKEFATKVDSYKIPWVFTFGNDDEIGKYPTSDLIGALEGLEYCKFMASPDKVYGVTNQIVIVKNAQGQPFLSLSLLDSNGSVKDGKKRGLNFIRQSQLDWYAWNINALKAIVSKDGFLNDLAFFHNPIKEFMSAHNLGEGITGDRLEPVSFPKYDTGVFDYLSNNGTTSKIFCANDMENTFWAYYKNVEFLNCRRTQYDKADVNQIKPRGALRISATTDGNIFVSRFIL